MADRMMPSITVARTRHHQPASSTPSAVRGAGGEPTGISDTPIILGSLVGATCGCEPFLGRDANRQRPGGNLCGEGAAFSLGHITVELIGIGMTQPDLDARALPLVHPVVGASPEGDQPDEHPYPVSEAVR